MWHKKTRFIAKMRKNMAVSIERASSYEEKQTRFHLYKDRGKRPNTRAKLITILLYINAYRIGLPSTNYFKAVVYAIKRFLFSTHLIRIFSTLRSATLNHKKYASGLSIKTRVCLKLHLLFSTRVLLHPE